MELFLEVFLLCITGLVRANQTFQYEKLHDFGLSRRLIPNFRRMGYENVEPLPPSPPSVVRMIRDPYTQLYQGVRRRSRDRRVFRKEFDIPPADTGHRILCESLVECVITHIAIETEEGIPIILRGGVGYRHFSIVVRAKPGYPIKGNIRIFCNKDPDDKRVAGGET